MNAESGPDRERLLDLDPPHGPARAEYELALQTLFERRLAGFERVRYVALTGAGAIMALGLGSLALTEPSTTPWATRVVLGVLAAMGATWFVVGWRLLRRGSVHLIADRKRIASIVFLFAVLQCGFFGWLALKHPDGYLGLYVGLVALVVAAVGYVVQRLRAIELRGRERTLMDSLARGHG